MDTRWANNEETVFEAAMLGIVSALAAAGWRVIVGVTGHDVAPQRDAMQRAIETGTAGTGSTGFAVMEGELHSATAEFPYTMDHAGAWETSCMLHACPECVDLEDLRERCVSSGDHFAMSAPEGIGGYNPLKYASPELGAQIIDTMAELIGKKARAMIEALPG